MDLNPIVWRVDRGVIIGYRLLVCRGRQAAGAPIVDGAGTTVDVADEHDGPVRSFRFGGVAIMPRPRGRSVIIGWHDARTPYPARWRWLPAALRRSRGHMV